MGKLFIFGTGSHARKIYHYALALGYEVAEFVDENIAALSPILNVGVSHAASLLAPLNGEVMFVAIGRPDVRMRVMNHLASVGWSFPAIIHPTAYVAPHVVLGAGCVVCAHAVVETGSVIGAGTIVDVGSIVDHDCQVGEYSHLKAGCILQAYASIGNTPPEQ